MLCIVMQLVKYHVIQCNIGNGIKTERYWADCFGRNQEYKLAITRVLLPLEIVEFSAPQITPV
jgi:hypothetical protein